MLSARLRRLQFLGLQTKKYFFLPKWMKTSENVWNYEKNRFKKKKKLDFQLLQKEL